jgi:hypothetical protein
MYLFALKALSAANAPTRSAVGRGLSGAYTRSDGYRKWAIAPSAYIKDHGAANATYALRRVPRMPDETGAIAPFA